MTISVSITCECQHGRTLEGLSDVIRRRGEILGETTRDAVIASAIDVLVSLRALTRDAKRTRRFPCEVEECDGLRPSFTSGGRRCLRHRGGGRFEASRVRWVTKNLPDSKLKVFKVTPQHKSVTAYYVVTDSRKTAQDFENRAAKHRVENYGTLAKWALGVAMNKISTRNVQDGVSGPARNAGSKLARAVMSGSGFGSGEFSVEVNDDLDYAVDALKNGSGSVDVSMQRAANKIAGILTHHLHAVGDFGRDVEKPFPEVSRRK